MGLGFYTCISGGHPPFPTRSKVGLDEDGSAWEIGASSRN
jgi:hypothetical protein